MNAMTATASPVPAPTPADRAALADQIIAGLVDVAASQAQIDDLAPERSSPAKVAAALDAAHELEAAVADVHARADAAGAALAAKQADVQALRDHVAALRHERDVAALHVAVKGA